MEAIRVLPAVPPRLDVVRSVAGPRALGEMWPVAELFLSSQASR